MLFFAGLIEITGAGVFLLSAVPESLVLLIFGVGLMGATAGLRRILKRQDSAVAAASGKNVVGGGGEINRGERNAEG